MAQDVHALLKDEDSKPHVPEPRAERNALIAANAIVHGMTVVAGNRADIEATGVALIDPWAKRDRGRLVAGVR